MNTGQDTSIEPGLLPVFRLLIGFRLAVSTLMLCAWLADPTVRTREFPLLSLIETSFLMLYLSWKWPQRLLGQAYLPLAVLIASVGPVVGYMFKLGVRLRAQAADQPLADDAWMMIFALLIPLLVTSWQYRFRVVAGFSVGVAVLQLSLIGLLGRVGGPSVTDAAGTIIFQAVLFIVMGYILARLMSAQRRQRAELAEVNVQLAQHAVTLQQLTLSHERNRLARELHDTLAHSLSAVAVQLEAVKSLWDDSPQEAQALLEQSLATTRRGLQETRRAIGDLRASPLEDLGLALAIRHLAEGIAGRAGLALEIEVPDEVTGLSQFVEQGVYRIVDEALANVERHAYARTLTVRLAQQGDRLRLHIRDDGRGFDPTETLPNGHYGLKGLHERAYMIGATLNVRSAPGQGTTLELEVG